MTKYLINRLITMVPILIVISMVGFSLMQIIPGDPAVAMLGQEGTPELIEKLRTDLGLDEPVHVQYLTWLGRAVQGDLGRSIRTRQPVTEAIAARLPVTVQLALTGMIVGLLIALPVGIISAVRRHGPVDHALSVFSLFGVSMPTFFLGILFILLFAVWLHWLPASGYVKPLENPLGNLQSMIMPATVLGIWMSGIVGRQARASMLEALSKDYVRTARAKGLREQLVLSRHVLKNALLPVVTVVGLLTGRLFGGAVVTETVFALPGIGRMAVDAIFAKDFPLVQGVVLVMGTAVLLTNLMVDLLYGYLDPRIKYG